MDNLQLRLPSNYKNKQAYLKLWRIWKYFFKKESTDRHTVTCHFWCRLSIIDWFDNNWHANRSCSTWYTNEHHNPLQANRHAPLAHCDQRAAHKQKLQHNPQHHMHDTQRGAATHHIPRVIILLYTQGCREGGVQGVCVCRLPRVTCTRGGDMHRAKNC